MDKEKHIEEVAEQILKYSRNEMLVSLRYMDLALCKLEYKSGNTKVIATDGKYLYYNPFYIFELYKKGGNELNRSYLHTVFHCIFYHPFVNKSINRELWDLSCDIAIEGVINDLGIKHLESNNMYVQNNEIYKLLSKINKLTAEKIYRYFQKNNISSNEIKKLSSLFSFDDHSLWYLEEESNNGNKDNNNGNKDDGNNEDKSNCKENKQNDESLNNQNASLENLDNQNADSKDGISEELKEWTEISERVKVDIETLSSDYRGNSDYLLQNVTEVNREKYDYTEFLKKFSILGEEMKINDDEFDYIFYTYGLNLYENVPLIEPLEYKDVKRIKEFVLVIDTSGSVQGELVQNFVKKTYNILKSTESFFSKINLHIIQCDDKVREDKKITSQEEFDEYFKNMKLQGFMGTDFRKAFTYIDELIEKKEFTNLKGMIYFSDGYGFFPKKKPNYDVAFVFVDNDEGNIPKDIPSWVIKLVLEEEDI